MSSGILFCHRNAKEKAYARLWRRLTTFCELGAAVVNQANDGERHLLFAADSEQPSKGSIDESKLTLLAEELSVGKEAAETGRVRVSKQTHTREVAVDEDLLRESAEIETVPIGRQIFEMP